MGVAYSWKEWVLDDARVCSPGGQRRDLVPLPDVQQAVTDQASLIRDMKEGQGLTNKDPKVQAAVAELLRLKGMLEASK